MGLLPVFAPVVGAGAPDGDCRSDADGFGVAEASEATLLLAEASATSTGGSLTATTTRQATGMDAHVTETANLTQKYRLG